MLIFYNGETGATQFTWHAGDKVPAIPFPSGLRVVRIQVDGDELEWLLAYMRGEYPRLRRPEAAAAQAQTAAGAANEPRRSPKSTTTPADPDPDSLYELFREVRRWKELDWITPEAYAYFLDRWALLCVQMRAGQ